VTQTQLRDRSASSSPVSDATYDLMQALTSKLEAIEAYEMYREDARGYVRELFEDLLDDDRRHAERLLEALRNELR
jgi:rubrerythrin